ncbi:hypothetical protein ON010_g15837 [Phytophthora cinnamomi]|nr:hypothetical protein ON010_g15837 [Phytophthora cinnamomi]
MCQHRRAPNQHPTASTESSSTEQRRAASAPVVTLHQHRLQRSQLAIPHLAHVFKMQNVSVPTDLPRAIRLDLVRLHRYTAAMTAPFGTGFCQRVAWDWIHRDV